MNVIESSNLCKNYGKDIGIKNINLQIEQGEVFGFIGPNGAGKSTFIRTLMGFLLPSSGTASILGQSIEIFTVFVKRLGICPQKLIIMTA